MVKLS
jgi:hypothetical protein